ncbi:MAG: PaaI family thioesterase [Pseudomonadota bacterium]
MTDAATDDFALAVRNIRAGLGAQGMLHHLGVEIDEIAPGRVTLSLPFRKEVAQQNGFFHGGAIGFLVDDATAPPRRPCCATATPSSPPNTS